MKCQCGYPDTPCDKQKHDYLHDCVAANERGGLKPQNIVQAAEADMKRERRNQERAKLAKNNISLDGIGFEVYAFHRKHVRRALTAHDLMVLALMDPVDGLRSAKDNTRLIYGDAGLLLQALRVCDAGNPRA